MGTQIASKSAKILENGIQKINGKSDAKTEATKEGIRVHHADLLLGGAGGKGGRFDSVNSVLDL